jgi:2-oxoglutarate ferredoxin oxidoreductase subunit alpha
MNSTEKQHKPSEQLDKVVIRFAGDSGDGMQFTGSQFAFTSALVGNDLATFPDFPAEIRAPKGTVGGVSGFQVQIGGVDILTPGDAADVLVAMNPAALKSNLPFIKPTANVILDIDAFNKRSLQKAGYESDPLEDDSLDDYHIIKAPITSLTKKAVEDTGLDNKGVMRCRNMFALGLVYWLFERPLDQTKELIESKFGKKAPEVAEANQIALQAGFNYGVTVEALPSRYTIPPAKQKAGKYRHISGNIATAWGLMAAREKLNMKLFYGSYPITPASDILHELSKYKQMDVLTLQAEDEIAAVCSAIGASYAGHLGVTASSGPGLALKAEAINLALMAELPLIVINVQRGGPSTGLPTKTEQSDLTQAIHGRNGDSPMIVIAPATPGQCFNLAYLSAKLTVEHMTPVMLLSDGYLANGSEPWPIPDLSQLPDINIPTPQLEEDEKFMPYHRDPDKLSRYMAAPGTPGMEHRIGGLEKEEETGNVSYDPYNHENMVQLRADKIQRVADYLPEQEVVGPERGELLIVGWGSTYGALKTAVQELLAEGHLVSLAHFQYINPLPKNTAEVFGKFEKRLVCELNLGQFARYLRGKHPEFGFESYTKIQGLPFTVAEIKAEVLRQLES